jgi:hypothetical protein
MNRTHLRFRLLGAWWAFGGSTRGFLGETLNCRYVAYSFFLSLHVLPFPFFFHLTHPSLLVAFFLSFLLIDAPLGFKNDLHICTAIPNNPVHVRDLPAHVLRNGWNHQTPEFVCSL